MGVPVTSYDALFLVFTLLGYIVQLVSWLWVRRLGRRLGDSEGRALVDIISFLLGWTLVLRTLSIVLGAYLALNSRSDGLYEVILASQAGFLVVALEVWRRMRNLSRP